MRAQRGLTLAELMVVVSIAAIMLGIGIPSFQGLMAQHRATSAANQLQSSLQFARSTAAAQARPVTICVANFATTPVSCSPIPNNRNWHEGWIVRLDDPTLAVEERVLRVQRRLNTAITLRGSPQWVYSSTGTLTGQGLDRFLLRVEETDPIVTRTICMSLSGSSRIFQGDVPC